MEMTKEKIARAIPLLGLSLAFWGLEGGFLWLALPMAAVLEGGRLIERRADLDNRDFIRISDLCAVILGGMVVYFMVTLSPREAALAIFQHLPLPLYPLMLAQAVSVAGKVPMGTVVWSARKLPPGQPFQGVDIAYPFAGLCILCASLGNHRGGDYYLGLAALAALALWRFRPRSAPPFAWTAMFLAALGAGFLGYRCLESLQAYLERVSADWFYEYLSRDSDPFRSITAIGELGELHLRNRALFRVKREDRGSGPLLLRRAVYDSYHSGAWVSTQGQFAELPPGAEPGSYSLCPHSGSLPAASILMSLRKGRGLIPVTESAVALSGLPAGQLKENRLGAVYAEGASGLLLFTIRNGTKSCEGPPTSMDLVVPERQDAPLRALAESLGILDAPPEEAIRKISDFFSKDFSYSLKLKAPQNGREPLADFLTKTRKGHCELFATATVLLLREARVYARYATGYLAAEPSGVKSWLVVRERHAHAWARAYVNGAWIDLDNTPPGWIDLEEKGVGAWAKAMDFLSSLWFRVNLFRSEGGSESAFPYAMAVVLLLCAFLFFRIFKRRWVLQRRTNAVEDAGKRWFQGMDSEFFQVLIMLSPSGRRNDAETLEAYLRRLDKLSGLDPRIFAAARLHTRYRFDPEGITPQERELLSSLAREILAGLS